MIDIPLIASAIEIMKFVYEGEKWIGKHKEWETGIPHREIEKEFKFGVEYYTLSPCGNWRIFNFGGEKFSEDKRLNQKQEKLIDEYPGLEGQLLVDGRIGRMPYQELCRDTDQVMISVHDSQFTIHPTLKDIRDAIYRDLVQHFRHIGIIYEPYDLARVCDWRSTPKQCMDIEIANYTDVAATNLIADLNLSKAIGKAPLRPDRLEITKTLREYDSTLSEAPGGLPSFGASLLANPIGVAGLAITADNKILLTHRPRSVSTYADKLGPSASGYLMWSDVPSTTDGYLNTYLLAGLKREIYEELHLDISRDVSMFKPLGIFREMYRAGMPQAFYAFKTWKTSTELYTAS